MEQWERVQRRIRRRHKEYNIKINSLASVQKGFHYYHWSSRSIIGRSFMRQKREKEIIWAAEPYFHFLSVLRFGTHTEAVREGTLRADMLCYRILLNSSATRFGQISRLWQVLWVYFEFDRILNLFRHLFTLLLEFSNGQIILPSGNTEWTKIHYCLAYNSSLGFAVCTICTVAESTIMIS